VNQHSFKGRGGEGNIQSVSHIHLRVYTTILLSSDDHDQLAATLAGEERRGEERGGEDMIYPT